MNDGADLGRHEVDMSVYAKVAAHETLKHRDVVRLNSGFTEMLGISRTPGVTARLEDDGRLHIDISVIVRHRTDLRSLGPAIQQDVLSAIRNMSDQPVGQINVYIADIEFAKDEANEAPQSNKE